LSVKPQLTLVRPARVDDPISIEFMFADLARSGLTPQDIGAYPVDHLKSGLTGSYVIPYHDELMYRQRFNRKTDKYTQPRGRRDIWWSPHQTLEELRAADTIYVIEGEKKAARFLKQWPKTAVIGIGGAWNFMEPTEIGTTRLIKHFVETLRPGKQVVAIFDGDILAKASIQMAATTLREHLRQFGCDLQVMYPPEGKGVDDWLEAVENPQFSDLNALAFDALAESRKQLYAVLGCSLNEGKLILNEFNAEKLLAHYFEDTVYYDKRLGPIFRGSRIQVDHFDAECIRYMQGQISPYYKTGAIKAAAGMVMLTRKRDLVQETLRQIHWDGVERLNTWAHDHFTAEWPEWTSEWGRILMTGLGLRILEPGVKADKVCILAGPQGCGKSTFFETLSDFMGERFYYACTQLASSAGDANRTQGMMLARSTVVDLAEGVVFETRKQTMDTVKQVLTQTEDEYRIPYSKSPTIEPRGYIFVGTTNRYDQLSDATGSRRYCYLKVNKIKPLPYETKMQILAEVAAKQAEIMASNWWEEQVDTSTMPESMKSEGSEHIASVQELMNLQFTKADAGTDFILDLIEAGELMVLEKTGEQYITANYIAARSGAQFGDIASVNMWSRRLSALANSPTFPYKIVGVRKRLPQLTGGNEHVKAAYMRGINNSQMMINGYVVVKKEAI